jgi:hypothetical protein
MNAKSIVIAVILGASIPVIPDVAVLTPAIAAKTYDYPSGSFSNGTWFVDLTFRHNTYRYHGEYKPKGSSVDLIGATPSGSHERQIYTWQNNGLKYQVIWQPSDPSTIRLRVITRGGTVQLNTILQS